MQENLNLETLQKQYQIVKSETTTSHVMEYGDMVSCALIYTFIRRESSKNIKMTDR